MNTVLQACQPEYLCYDRCESRELFCSSVYVSPLLRGSHEDQQYSSPANFVELTLLLGQMHPICLLFQKHLQHMGCSMANRKAVCIASCKCMFACPSLSISAVTVMQHASCVTHDKCAYSPSGKAVSGVAAAGLALWLLYPFGYATAGPTRLL